MDPYQLPTSLQLSIISWIINSILSRVIVARFVTSNSLNIELRVQAKLLFPVKKQKNVIALTVDSEKPVTSMEFGGSVFTDTNHPLYIGGYPPTLAASRGIETSAHFIGCLKNLEINGKVEDLSSSVTFGDVMFNVCPTI